MESGKSIPRLNLPTALTLSRIVVIPLMIYVLPGNNVAGAIIFSLASITDFLDGYLARRSGQVTDFGKLIDPIADKFLVIAALITLVSMDRVSVLLSVIIIAREFLVTALRVVALSKGIVIQAEMGGKIKTGLQIAGLICLMVAWRFWGLDFYDIGTVVLWVAAVIGVISGTQYLVGFWRRTAGAPDAK